jgi:NTP pyrophosphatase (non-canonical NTP hydrolase)
MRMYDAKEIAETLHTEHCITVTRHDTAYSISATEDGMVYGWLMGGDEGDPAATPCFGEVGGDEQDDYSEPAEGIVRWLASPFNLNDYAALVHRSNRKWWVSLEDGHTRLQRNKGELLMLMVSEIAEAMEGERKGLKDDKLPHRRMAEVELADCLIRIFDYAGAFGYDLEGAYREKMLYNQTREDHKHEARVLAGGKKW